MVNIRKWLLLATVAIGSCMAGYAQIISNETRRSEGQSLRTGQLLQLPTYRVPAFDQDSARIAMEEETSLRTYRFAHTITTDIDIIRDGLHTRWSDGTEVWRYRVKSAGAKSLGFFFGQFDIPKGAYLYIYSTSNRENSIGGFGADNVNSYGSLPVQPIFSDDVVIELQAPKGSQPKLRLSELQHGVRSIEGFRRFYGPQAGDPTYLLCTPEVACYPEYRDIARSVVVVLTSDGSLGTGSLVNNTMSDGRPLVLTASHVFTKNFRVRPYLQVGKREAERAIFFFNYQTPTCDGTVQPGNLQSIAGSQLIGLQTYTDVALAELSQKPPIAYSPYYAGWNAKPDLNEAHANIHHPRGYSKRINMVIRPLKYITYPDHNKLYPFGAFQHLDIEKWDLGTTDGGSSGSPLLDSEHRIIGVLSGGNSFCNSPGADYFGTLEKLWAREGGDITESNKIIQALDPGTKGRATTCRAKGATSAGGSQAPIRVTNMSIPASNKNLAQLLPQMARERLLGSANGATAVGESYRVEGGTKLYGVYIMLQGKANAPDKMELTIYGNGGETKLYSEWVSLKDLVTNTNVVGRFAETYVGLDQPLELPTDQVLYFGINTSTIPEEVSIVHQQKENPATNTLVWQVNGQWVPFTQLSPNSGGVSLWIDPVISHTKLQVPEPVEPRVKITPIRNNNELLITIGKEWHSPSYQVTAYTLLGEPLYSITRTGDNHITIPRVNLEGVGIVILRIEGDDWSETVKAYFPKN